MNLRERIARLLSPLPDPVFKDCKVRGGSVSEGIFRDGLCLPSGTALIDVELERVAGILQAACRGMNQNL